MRIAFFLLSCLGMLAQAHAQQVFKINYTLSAAKGNDNDSAALPPLYNRIIDEASTTAQIEVISGITAYTDKFFSKIDADTIAGYALVFDKASKKSTLLIAALQQYVSFAEETETTDQAVDGQYVDSRGQNYQLTFVADSSKTIAGYPCKLALVDLDIGEYNANLMDPPQIKVWYAEDIPVVNWGDYSYLQNIPGAALSIAINRSYIQATQVQRLEKKAAIFEIPGDYSLLQEDEDWNDIPLAEDRFTFQDPQTQLIGILDENQQVMAEAKYSSISEFVADLALVTDTLGRYGILQKDGKERIACAYENLIIDEENNLLLFTENGQMGVMDINKQIHIPARFAYLSTFSSGLAVYAEGDRNGLINLKGEIVLPANLESIIEYNDQHAIALEGEQYFLLDIATKQKSVKGYDYLSFANEAGLLVASENNKYGYINISGETIIPFKYIYATPFYDGAAAVNEKEDDEPRYINSKGNYVQVDATE